MRHLDLLLFATTSMRGECFVRQSTLIGIKSPLAQNRRPSRHLDFRLDVAFSGKGFIRQSTILEIKATLSKTDGLVFTWNPGSMLLFLVKVS